MNWYLKYTRINQRNKVLLAMTSSFSWYRVAKYTEDLKQQIEYSSKNNPYPFSSWFGDKDRIYLPFGEINGDNFQVDQDVENELKENGYAITDYVGGYCTKDGKRQVRIGKVLQKIYQEKLREKQEEFSNEEIFNVEEKLKNIRNYYEELMGTFQNSPLRTSKKSSGLSIVISQNPHDIAQMSTGRDWTSCMDLSGGAHSQDIFCEVANGGLIAYLIHANDKDIQNPLARIRIRRFDSSDGHSIAVAENSVYGNEVSGFLPAVRDWLKRVQPNIPADIYTMKGGEYSDTFNDSFLVLPENEEEIKKWFRGEIDFDKYTEYQVVDTVPDISDSEGNFYNYDIEGDEKVIDSFNTIEEAESWIMNNDVDDTWRDYYGEPYTERDEDGKYEYERYEINKKTNLTEDTARTEIAKKIITAPRNTYSIDLINEIKEWAFRPKSISNSIRGIFSDNYPELLTNDDLKKLDNFEYYKHVQKMKDSPEKEAILKDMLISLDRRLDLFPEVLRDKITDFFPTNEKKPEDPKEMGRWFEKAKLELLTEFGSNIRHLIDSIHKSNGQPIPDSIAEKLINLPVEIQKEIENHNKFNKTDIDLPDQVYDRLRIEILHILSWTDTDTPRVQSFYKDLLPKWDFNKNMRDLFWNENTSFNLNTLGFAIGALGPQNGCQFLPDLKQKQKQAYDYFLQIKNDLEQNPQDSKSKDKFKAISKFIERLYYIVEKIEIGETSGKYRW